VRRLRFDVRGGQDMKGRNALVYAAVRRIPRGRVATYGQIARLVGLGGLARQVGYALNALPAHTGVPWHRVINARGQISMRRVFGADIEQRIRLEREGVRFNAAGAVSLAEFGWNSGRGATQRRALQVPRVPGARGSRDGHGLNPARSAHAKTPRRQGRTRKDD
jgi:methylated-DNA-protein-cysteine methyltransferase related protein